MKILPLINASFRPLKPSSITFLTVLQNSQRMPWLKNNLQSNNNVPLSQTECYKGVICWPERKSTAIVVVFSSMVSARESTTSKVVAGGCWGLIWRHYRGVKRTCSCHSPINCYLHFAYWVRRDPATQFNWTTIPVSIDTLVKNHAAHICALRLNCKDLCSVLFSSY